MIDPQRELPYVKAQLWVRRTAEGGRVHPIFPGYRASWHVPQPDGSRIYTDSAVYPVEVEEIAPGNAGLIRIYPTVRENWSGVQPGTEIEMCEGNRLVGVAAVVAALPAGTTDATQPAVASLADR